MCEAVFDPRKREWGKEANGKASTSFYHIHPVLTNSSSLSLSDAPRHRRHCCPRVYLWNGALIRYVRNMPTRQSLPIPLTPPLVQHSSGDEKGWRVQMLGSRVSFTVRCNDKFFPHHTPCSPLLGILLFSAFASLLSPQLRCKITPATSQTHMKLSCQNLARHPQ